MLRQMNLVLCLMGICAASSGKTAPPDHIAGIDVEGTMFKVRLASGKLLVGVDLVGATLTLTQSGTRTPLKVFIESVKTDPSDPAGEVLLHHLLGLDPVNAKRSELCEANADGERWGFPLKGQWDSEGRHISNQGYTLTCSGDAQGKCVRFGYKPWKILANGIRLDAYHATCVKLVRADYCGGHGTTRDGMLIDFYDSIGIQSPDPKAAAAGLTFEAAWNPAGAVCVAHTRVPANSTLQSLAAQCPRLAGRLGAACTPELAGQFAEPVLMYNASR